MKGQKVIGEKPERPTRPMVASEGDWEKMVFVENAATGMLHGLRVQMVHKLEEHLAAMPNGFTACVHENWDILHEDMDTFKITQQLHFLDGDSVCEYQGRKTQYRWSNGNN